MRRFLALLLCAGWLILPVRAEQTKYAALTFDDGPSGKYTPELLEGLYERGVHATFLVCGYRVKDFPELMQRLYDEGHEVGFHGYSHKAMDQMSRREIAQELMDTQALLPQGCRPKFLRPPGGNLSDALYQVAQVRNLAILGWSVDPRDWATQDHKAVEAAVLNNVRDGDIILLHDASHSSVEAALNIIDALHAQGYELVTVSELAGLRNARMVPGKVYKHFYPQ